VATIPPFPPSAGLVDQIEAGDLNATGQGGVDDPTIAPVETSTGGTAAAFSAGLTHGVLLQDAASHVLDVLLLNSDFLQGTFLFDPGLPKVVGDGDFNGDGCQDLVTQLDDGRIELAFFSGQQLIGTQLEGGQYSPVKGAGDFTGFTSGPAVAIQDASGQIDLLGFTGANLSQSLLLEGRYQPLVAVGDFNGDGQADMVAQDSAGHIDFLFFNRTGQLIGTYLVPGAYEPVRAAADTNHDGHTDLVTQNPATGEINHLLFDGINLVGTLMETTPVSFGVVPASHFADQYWGL
jgi:hypothetical protein